MRPDAGGVPEIVARLGAAPGRRLAERCANCGIAIDADRDRVGPGAAGATSRIVRGDDVYCCDGCAEGGPCTC
jgi:cytochrome c2